jgi:hypothetical protein
MKKELVEEITQEVVEELNELEFDLNFKFEKVEHINEDEDEAEVLVKLKVYKCEGRFTLFPY